MIRAVTWFYVATRTGRFMHLSRRNSQRTLCGAEWTSVVPDEARWAACWRCQQEARKLDAE